MDGDVNHDDSGSDTHTLANPRVTDYQEAFVRKVIDTVGDLDNVLYEVSNESPDNSIAWQYHMIDYIKAYEATKPKQHPVGMTGRYEWPLSDLLDSHADWISPGGGAFQWDPQANDGQKVIINDTDHLWGIGGDRVWVWKSFTRGLNPIFMDQYDDSYKLEGGGYDMNNPTDVSLRANLGYTRQYAERMNLAAMTPRSDLCSTNYCLANPSASGAEFIVYQPNSGSFTVKLAGVNGPMAVEWMDPKSGAKTAGTAVNGGATRTFTPPFSGDAVLYLSQPGSATATPTATATPLPTAAATATTAPPTPTPTFVAPTATPTVTRMPTSTATAVPPTATPVPGAVFPITPLLDNFNRANSAQIGAAWAGSKSGYRIAGGRLDVGPTSDIYWKPARFGENQEVYVTLTTIDTAALEIGLILKAQSNTGLGAGLVEVLYSPRDRTVQVWTYTTRLGWQQQGPSLSSTFVDGDRLGARVYSSGRVEVYRNTTLLGQWSIAAWRYASAAGYIGIFTLQAANAVLDDFGGGAVGVQSSFDPDLVVVDESRAEEFALLRYKANVWLPAIQFSPD